MSPRVFLQRGPPELRKHLRHLGEDVVPVGTFDLVNAGATWVDEPVVVDGNIVSSRVPKDLPAFGVELVRLLSARNHPAT